MKRIVISVVLVALLIAAGGYATEPAIPEEPTKRPDLQQAGDEGAPVPFPEQMIAGNVADSRGKPLARVTIKLFADGRLVELGYTTASGTYELRLPVNVETDQTVVLWFVPSSGGLLPQTVILKKSTVANNYSLFSPCDAQLRLRPQMRIDVKLMNENELLTSLKSKGCL